MNKNLQNYFTTGEFAKICRVNKRTLFHYHDIDLFSPAIIDENGYRYYSHHQLDVFNIIAILKELNIPLKDIKAYLDMRTPEELLKLSKEKISEIDDQIKELNLMKHLLEETIVYTNKALNADYNKILIEEQEEEYIILSNFISEENTDDYTKEFIEFIDFTDMTESKDTSFVGTMLSKENIINNEYDKHSYLFVKTVNRCNQKEVSVKPKGLYAVAYHLGHFETMHETYKRLLEFIHINNLEMGAYAYEEYLIDEVAAKNEKDYVTQITIQVEKL